MRLSRRTNTIILWIVSIGLLVGMIITFTPTLGALTGGGAAGDTSAPALTVDGETISELDVAQARQSSQLFTIVQEGPVAEDLELLLVDTLIRQEVVRQEAARQRVGNGEVRDELEAFRERNGVAGSRNDEAYLRLIGGAGYTDQTFRDFLRSQLQIQAWENEVTEGVVVDDAEIEAFYRVNLDAYQTDPRVRARQIVVDDAATAEELRARALAGEPFAELAAEASQERAEQGGAVGGEEPQPVGRPAFPTPVATQVFALDAPGLTPVVESGGRFFLVSVEEVLPAEPRPLDEVREQVADDALAAKRDAVLEARVEELVAAADVEVAEGSDLSIEDPVVARVGDEEIRSTDLVRATYTNPQIQQALAPQTAQLIADFFKPSILEQLIDRELAVQGAADLGATFFGSEALIAQSALDWVARDAEADDEEIRAFYEANPDRYTIAASADVLRVEFASAEQADAYRAALLDGEDPLEAADAAGAASEDLGVVREGRLEAPLDTALFATDAFAPLPGDDREVSDVLVLEAPATEEPTDDAGAEDAPAPDAPASEPSEADASTAADDTATEDAATEDAATDDAGTDDAAAADASPDAAAVDEAAETYVVLVATRSPERVRPLDEVRADVAATVLAQERQELQRAWLTELREEIVVENLLVSALNPSEDGADAAAGDGEGSDDADASAADGGASESAEDATD
jgi:parvulin-like peptidyl-prolyl isomerase